MANYASSNLTACSERISGAAVYTIECVSVCKGGGEKWMGKEMDGWVEEGRSSWNLGTKLCPPWGLFQSPAGAEGPLALIPYWGEELIQGRAAPFLVGNTKISPSAHIQVHMHIFKKEVGQRK